MLLAIEAFVGEADTSQIRPVKVEHFSEVLDDPPRAGGRHNSNSLPLPFPTNTSL